jgi:hypothetical protein
MKTPRDILLARHQTAAPKLDAIRRTVVTGLDHQVTKSPSEPNFLVSWCLRGFNKFWQELIFPCRRIWTGLAAVWILLCVVNFSQRGNSQTLPAKSSPPMALATTFRDQQKLLSELLADRSLPLVAERPRIFTPKPRTEILQSFTA